MQVLVGFGYRAAFEPRFDQLRESERIAAICGLALLTWTLNLLLAPAAYHLIVDRGEDTLALKRFANGVIEIALLPFALGVAAEVYIAGTECAGVLGGAIVAGSGAVVAIVLWYIVPRLHGSPVKPELEMEQAQPTDLSHKVEHVLQETRIVLPGAQALLGFQFITVLMTEFQKLPHAAQAWHLAALTSTLVSTLLLIAPAAYHRIAERGEDTEHFHMVAGRLLLWAMAFLGIGVAIDFGVVLFRITGGVPAAVAGSLATLLFGFGLWFGYTFRRHTANARDRLKP